MPRKLRRPDPVVRPEVDMALIGTFTRLQLAVQRTWDMVAHGLRVAANIDEANAAMSDSFFKFLAASNEAMTGKAAIEEFKLWVVEKGVQDLIEALNPMLKEVRLICSTVELASKPRLRESDVRRWQRLDPKSAADFEGKGLVRKLEYILKEYSVGLGGEMFRSVSSIYSARNCIVHNRSIVNQQSADGSGGLTVSWIGFQHTAHRTTGSEPLFKHDMLSGGERMTVKPVAASKHFMVGERVTFTPEEFNELGYTIVEVAKAYLISLEQVAVSKGVKPEGIETQVRKLQGPFSWEVEEWVVPPGRFGPSQDSDKGMD